MCCGYLQGAMSAHQEIVPGVGNFFQSDSDAEDHRVGSPASRDVLFDSF